MRVFVLVDFSESIEFESIISTRLQDGNKAQ